MKAVRIIFSKEAEEVYQYLNRSSNEEEKRILKMINKKIEFIKENFHYGEPISKKKIPNKYIQKYGITNLFWVELPHFWRMIYSLREGETKIEIIAFVLDIINHKTYDKIFGYRRK